MRSRPPHASTPSTARSAPVRSSPRAGRERERAAVDQPDRIPADTGTGPDGRVTREPGEWRGRGAAGAAPPLIARPPPSGGAGSHPPRGPPPAPGSPREGGPAAAPPDARPGGTAHDRHQTGYEA